VHRLQPFWPMATLAAVALFARLVVLFTGPWTDPTRPQTFSGDAPRYAALADTLLRQHAFGKPHEDGLVHCAVEQLRRDNGTLPPADEHGLYPEVFRTPGYPAFLAIFGGRSGLHLAFLAQSILGSLATVSLVQIARQLGCEPRAALVSGYLWALHPAVVTYDLMPLTESLFCSLAMIGLAVSAIKTTPASGVCAGLLIGLAALVRPLGLLYLPTALILGWNSASRRWRAAILTVIVAAMPSTLWMVRNHQTGNGARVSTVGNINLYFYGAAYVISESRDEDWLASWPKRVEELASRLASRLKRGEDVFSLARKEALAEFRTQPMTTARVALKSIVKLAVDHSLHHAVGLFGMDYQPSGFFSELLRGKLDTSKLSLQALLAVPWSALNVILLLLAVVGMIRVAVSRNNRLVLACLLPVLLFSAATFPVGVERFRLPMMPFLFILSTCAFWPPRRQSGTDRPEAGTPIPS